MHSIQGSRQVSHSNNPFSMYPVIQTRQWDLLIQVWQNSGHGTQVKSSFTYRSGQCNSHTLLIGLYTDSFGQSPHSSGNDEASSKG